MDSEAIGKRLIALRGERSRTKVACDIGVSESAISNYENGTRIPRDEIKKRIAAYYRVSVGSIFFD